MNEINETNTRTSELVSFVRDLARRHRRLVSRISKDELLADAIAGDIRLLEDLLAGGAAERDGKMVRFPRRSKNLGGSERLKREAELGARSLDIKVRSDGQADICIDQDGSFTLPPVLADLLYVLSIDSGQSSDGLIGWKTLDEVAILLKKKEGKKFTRHSVTQNISRLRKALERGGVNQFLVQTNRRRGARFALRREGAPELETSGGEERI